MNKKTYIIITVDTEADTINGRIIPISKMVYGEVERERYGITRIMDICEKHNFKSTFFVSVFESDTLGEDQMSLVCQEIYRRGHDVQLHTHPKWITQKGYMCEHSFERQKELLLHGKDLIHKWIGRYPIAHRAGSFGVNHDSLKALKGVGIPVDSSNIDSPYCELNNDMFKRNVIQESAEGIIELPVSQFVQFKLGRFQPVKPFDINANTLSEMKFVVKDAKVNGVKVLTLLMHSFSFLNRNKDRTRFTPNKGDMKKFDKLLEFIAKDKELEVITTKEFYKRYTTNPQLFHDKEYLPVSGYIRSIIRACRYIKRGKGNQIIVLSVFSIILLVLLLIFIFFA